MVVRVLGKGVNGFADEIRVKTDAVGDRLAKLVELTEQSLSRDQMRYERGNITDSTGTAIIEFPVRPGVEWYIQKMTLKGGAGPSGFSVFIGDTSDANRVDYSLFDANGIVSRPQADPLIWVPAGSRLIVQFFTAAPPANCAVNILIKEIAANE